MTDPMTSPLSVEKQVASSLQALASDFRNDKAKLLTDQTRDMAAVSLEQAASLLESISAELSVIKAECGEALEPFAAAMKSMNAEVDGEDEIAQDQDPVLIWSNDDGSLCIGDLRRAASLHSKLSGKE